MKQIHETPVELEIAQSILLEAASVCPKERVPLAQCMGRILAENIAADTDFPPFDRSPLDGYAVQSRDVLQATSKNPAVLREMDLIPAGCWPGHPVRPGTAARIMTGAPLPQGADGVIRLEDTCRTGHRVKIFSGNNAARNICLRGEEIKQGETVLRAGDTIHAGQMGLLALAGAYRPFVYCRPRIGLLATGSELVDCSQSPGKAKIRNSNNYMVAGQVAEAGGIPVLAGHVADDADQIFDRILAMPEDCDLYLTTGGVSIGDCDHMPAVFSKLDARILFYRVLIKPGMPVLAGRWRNRLIVGLSGNPAAAGAAFELLVRPVVRRLAGSSRWWRPRAKVEVTRDVRKSFPSRRFLWAKWHHDAGDRILAEPLVGQGNGMLKSMAAANALLDIPAGHPPLQAGQKVEALLFI